MHGGWLARQTGCQLVTQVTKKMDSPLICVYNKKHTILYSAAYQTKKKETALSGNHWLFHLQKREAKSAGTYAPPYIRCTHP